MFIHIGEKISNILYLVFTVLSFCDVRSKKKQSFSLLLNIVHLGLRLQMLNKIYHRTRTKMAGSENITSLVNQN